ncbi:MAG: hypothetical protein ACH346_05135 [Chthoniobacterales bacterium]
MNEPIRSAGTTSAFAVGGERDRSSVSTEAGSIETESAQQVLTGSTVIIDSPIPEAIQDSYNSSYASLAMPESAAAKNEQAELFLFTQQAANFIADQASADLSSKLLAANQIALEQAEKIAAENREQELFDANVVNPDRNNDFLKAAEAEILAVNSTLETVSNLAFARSPLIAGDIASAGGRPGPDSLPVLAPVSQRNAEFSSLFLLTSLTGSAEKTQKLLFQMAVRTNQNVIRAEITRRAERRTEAMREMSIKENLRSSLKTSGLSANEEPVTTDPEAEEPVTTDPETEELVTTDPETGEPVDDTVPENNIVHPPNEAAINKMYLDNSQGDALRAMMQQIASAMQAMTQHANFTLSERTNKDFVDKSRSVAGIQTSEATNKAIRDSFNTLDQLTKPLDAVPLNASR